MTTDTRHQPGIAAALSNSRPWLVAHIVEALAPLQAEQGLLNLIRHLPHDRYRHVIVCMNDHAALHTQDVEIITLNKRRGLDPLCYLRLFRLLREMQPDLIHTRDRTGLGAQVIAALAGVQRRVHAEHGRKRSEMARWRIGGRLLRRLVRPLVDHFIAVSSDLEHWLVESVGAEPGQVSQIANGVDSCMFHPRLGPVAAVGPDGFMDDNAFVIGSVGRMDDAMNHKALVEAFLRLIASPHPAHQRLRLLIVGDGPARAACQEMLNRAGAAPRAWLPGARSDVPQLLRTMDLFVQPSIAEDPSNSILAAMASGLPVIATAVGGHVDLVHPGLTGILVPPMSDDVLATAIADYCRIPEMALRHGARARGQVIACHSIPAMARNYLAVYDTLTRSTRGARAKELES